jgi:hypothetical protein
MSMTMSEDEFLRDKPNGSLTDVRLFKNDRVIVLETQDEFSKVEAFEVVNDPVGWVPSQSLTNIEVISKTVFANLCVDLELRFGIHAQYLTAVAELRSKTTADEKDGLAGPFRISQSEWDAGRADSELAGAFAAADRFDWRMQAVVFALMTSRTEAQLSSLLGRRETAAELLLAQMLGAKSAVALVLQPTMTVAAALQGVADSDLPPGGQTRAQLLQRASSLFDPNGTGAVVLSQIADALQPALDVYAPFIRDAGEPVVQDAITALPPAAAGGAPPGNGTMLPGAGAYLNIYPQGVVVVGDDLVVRNTKATFFGGPTDHSSNGTTASGININENPQLRGCALPLPRSNLVPGTPFPNLPFQTNVRVKNHATQTELTIPLIDVGPAASTGKGLDLTEAAFNGLGAASSLGVIDVDFTVVGGARFVSNNDPGSPSLVAPGDVGDVIPIPDVTTFNIGLSSAKPETMLDKFGVPGALVPPPNCANPAQSLKPQLEFGENVGPFRVSGLAFAINSLKDVFEEIRQNFPDVFRSIKTDGMLCVRASTGDLKNFSNHSWGTAVDLFFGKDPIPRGVQKCHRGLFEISAIFNKKGWYWGAGFSDPDSMHFELAEETVREKL